MKTRETKVFDLTSAVLNKIYIKGYNADLKILRFLGKYVFNFRCNLNGDANNEVVYCFDEPSEALTKSVARIFADQPQFTICDKDQNIEIEIGLSITNKVEIYFELIDYSYDNSQHIDPKDYNLKIDRSCVNYERLSQLLILIYREIDKKEEKRDEHKSDTIEYQRESRL